MIKKMKKMIALTAALISLNACTTPGAHMIPDGEMSMSQIYKKTMASNDSSIRNNQMPRESVSQKKRSPVINYTGYTSTSKNELKALFKTINNPQIPIYIYPHMVRVGDDDLPKPGYSSAFFLYKKVQFALPSENY